MTRQELLAKYAAGERDFREVDLSEEDLSNADLSGIDLSGANLSYVELHGVKLDGVNFDGAKLEGAEFYIGEIIKFNGPFTSGVKHLVPCKGKLLNISQNTALFSLLKTKYGGDGILHFALPNKPGFAIAIGGVYPPPE